MSANSNMARKSCKTTCEMWPALSAEGIELRIPHDSRGHRVLLNFDLAGFYRLSASQAASPSWPTDTTPPI